MLLKGTIALDLAVLAFALIMGLVYGVLYVINEEKNKKVSE